MKKFSFLLFIFLMLFSIFSFGVNFNSFDELIDNSAAVFLCKYSGHGDKLNVVGALKGSVPREIEIGSAYLENMEPDTLYLVFAKRKNPWRIYSDGYAYLTFDPIIGERVWKSPMNIERLLKNIDPRIRSELYRIPAPVRRKTHHPITIGTLVDEITHLPEGSPVGHESFLPVVKSLIKAVAGERYGSPSNPSSDLPTAFDMKSNNTNLRMGGNRLFKKSVKDITSCDGGTVLSIGDEDYAQINFNTFSFPFLGTTYTSCYVTDNGYVTFGGHYNTYYIDLYHFFNYLPPVIAPFFNDFDPGSGGTISYLEVSSNELVICWDELPDYYYPSYTCSFAVHLYSDGSFMFEYGTMDVYWQGIIGYNDGAEDTLSGDYDFSYMLTAGSGVAQINGNYKNVFDDYSNDLSWIDGGMIFFSGDPTGTDPVDILNNYNSMYNACDPFADGNGVSGWYDYTSPDGGWISPGETIWYKISLPGDSSTYYLVNAKVTSWDAYDTCADTMIGVFSEDGLLLDWFDDEPGYFGSIDPKEKMLVPGGTTIYLCITGTGDNSFTGSHTQDGPLGVHISAVMWGDRPLPLGDDDYLTIVFPSDAPFPMAGVNWNCMYLCSNGFVTFQYPDTDYSESISELESGPVRFCLYWDDLSPDDASYPYGVYFWFNGDDPTFQYSAIQFYGVPTFGGTLTNFFGFFVNDGSVITGYNLTDTDGLVGYGIGNTYPAGNSRDLSTILSNTSVMDWGTGLKNLGTGFELYYFELFDSTDNPCDLGVSGAFNMFQFFGMYNYLYMVKDENGENFAYFEPKATLNGVDRFKFLSLEKDYIFLSPTMDPIVAGFLNNYYFGVNDRMYPGYIQSKGKLDLVSGTGAVYLENYYFPGHLFKCIGPIY